MSPSLDSIDEFKVIETSGSADSGAGTVQIIIATKEGTNQFHGSAFAYNEVRALEAASFFATSIPKAEFVRNEFGGSMGGPIKRDKAFFFGSYEDYLIRTSSTDSDAMPTAALLSGNFSGLAAIKDPLTGAPFPNNQIPSGRISSIAQNFFPYFATPNEASSAAGGLGTNFVFNSPSTQDNNRWQGRVDYNFNTRNVLSGRYYFVNQSPYTVGGAAPKFGEVGEDATNHNLAINYTRIFSPTLVNLATFGWAREADERQPQNYTLQPSSIVPGLPADLPGLGGLPTVSITGFTGFSDNPGSGDRIPTYQYGDVLTWVKGSHTVKAGFSWLRWRFYNFQNPAPGHGSFTFTGQYTGNAFADFLLGDLAGSSTFIAPLAATPTNDRYGMFIQDSWKVRPRFTINYGLRYDVSSQYENDPGNMADFYPNLGELVIIKGQNNGAYPTLPIVSGSSVGINTGNWEGKDDLRIQPRIGFAYQPLGTSRLVVRAGYGTYSNYQLAVFGSYEAAVEPPWSGSESYEPQAGTTPTLTFANSFPTGAGSVASGPSLIMEPQHEHYPMSHEWNFTLESQLTNSTAVRATYLGVECEHCPMALNLNDPAPAPGPVQPLRPYQPWGAITDYEDGSTTSTESLQLELTRRFSSGKSFDVQYSWEKTLDDVNVSGSGGTPTDNRNIRLDRGNESSIRQQYLVANYIYNLPFGSGQRYLSTLRGPLNAILGGWETSGIVTVGSGLPYSVTFTSSVQGWPSSRANKVGNPSVANPSILQWFNPSAFALPQQFTFGDSAPYSLFGPRYSDWDMSAFKEFRLTERFRMEFRSDFFNTLNHPSFSNPAANISVTSTVGKISSTASSSRAIQFALRLTF